MGMAKSLSDLRATPTEELMHLHDNSAEHTLTGVNYYLNEIHRRESEAVAKSVERYTLYVAIMTAVMTVATILNVILFFLKG